MKKTFEVLKYYFLEPFLNPNAKVSILKPFKK